MPQHRNSMLGEDCVLVQPVSGCREDRFGNDLVGTTPPEQHRRPLLGELGVARLWSRINKTREHDASLEGGWASAEELGDHQPTLRKAQRHDLPTSCRGVDPRQQRLGRRSKRIWLRWLSEWHPSEAPLQQRERGAHTHPINAVTEPRHDPCEVVLIGSETVQQEQERPSSVTGRRVLTDEFHGGILPLDPKSSRRSYA